MNRAQPELAALLGRTDLSLLHARWPHTPLAAHGDPERLPAPLQQLRQWGPAGCFDRHQGAWAFGRGARTAHPARGDGHPMACYRMGLTVQLHDTETTLPAASPWLRALEAELGAAPGSARLAVFASPTGDGLPWHFDGEDVISVQLIGRKRFRLAPVQGLPFPLGEQWGPGMVAPAALYAQCAAGFPPPPRDDAAEQVTMDPGSVLFLPRGHWHHTEADADSLSVSVVLRPPTPLDLLLRRVQQALLTQPSWREPLYGSATDQQQRLDRHWAELLPLLQALPLPSQAADTLRWQAVPSARIELTAGERWQISVHAVDADGLPRISLQRPVGAALVPLIRWLAAQRAAFTQAEFERLDAAVPAVDAQRLLLGLQQAGALQRLG